MPNPAFQISPGPSAGGGGVSTNVTIAGAGATNAAALACLNIVWIYVKAPGQTITLSGSTNAKIIMSGSDANQSWAVASFYNPGPSNTSLGFAWQSNVSFVGGSFSFAGAVGQLYPTVGGIGSVGAAAANSGSGTTATFPNIATTQNQSALAAIVIGGGFSTPSTPSGWTSTATIAGSNESVNQWVNSKFPNAGTSIGTITSTVANAPWVAIVIEVLGQNNSNKITYPILRPQHPLAQGLLLAFPFYEPGNQTPTVHDVGPYQPQGYTETFGNIVMDEFGGTAYATPYTATQGSPSGSAIGLSLAKTRLVGLTQFGAMLRFQAGNSNVLGSIFSMNGTSGVQLRQTAINQLAFSLGGTTVTSSNSFSSGSWNTAGLSYDGATLSIVLNGVVTPVSAAGLSIAGGSATALFIGSDSVPAAAQVIMSNIYMFSRPIEPNEVQWLGADPMVIFRRQGPQNFGRFISKAKARSFIMG